MKLSFKSTKGKVAIVATAVLALSAFTFAQIKVGELIKVVGVTAAVAHFGPQMNREINKVAHTADGPNNFSKVVPILSGGINSRKAVGAAQVRGPRSAVNKVNAVAMIDQNLLGLRVKIMIPIASKDVIKDLKPVPGVGVTGIVDISVNI